MKHNVFFSTVVALLALCGCRSSYVQEVPNNPLVDEILLDTTSKHYVDFSSYPQEIDSLPIGVLTTCDEYGMASYSILNLDYYNNITGEAVPDEILDFAGEHFLFLALRDSLSGNLRDTAMTYTARLLQQHVKVVIIASPLLSDAALSTVRDLLRLSGTRIQAIGVIDSIDYENAASTCYKLLRNERNLALRITRQELKLQIIPEIECTPLQ